LDVVLRQEHKAGDKMFVDWAGATIPVYDATTGQTWPASLFVSVLGASSYCACVVPKIPESGYSRQQH
jgi:transposase